MNILSTTFKDYALKFGNSLQNQHGSDEKTWMTLYHTEVLLAFRDRRKQFVPSELALDVIPDIHMTDAGVFKLSLRNYHGYRLSTEAHTFLDAYELLRIKINQVNREVLSKWKVGE